MEDYAELIRNAENKAVGVKQVLLRLSQGGCLAVVLAEDVDSAFRERVLCACKNAGVRVISAPSRAELGMLAGIDVPCGVIGVCSHVILADG